MDVTSRVRSLVAHYPSSQYPQSILLLDTIQLQGITWTFLFQFLPLNILILFRCISSLNIIGYDHLHISIEEPRSKNENANTRPSFFLEAQFTPESHAIQLPSPKIWKGIIQCIV